MTINPKPTTRDVLGFGSFGVGGLRVVWRCDMVPYITTFIHNSLNNVAPYPTLNPKPPKPSIYVISRTGVHGMRKAVLQTRASVGVTEAHWEGLVKV